MAVRITNKGNVNTEETDVLEFQDDLATISCYAAGEIDNLILGNPKSFQAVKRLLKMIQKSLIVPSNSPQRAYLIDPTMAVAVNRALVDSYPDLEKSSLNTVGQLIKESKKCVQSLDQVVRDPNTFRRDQVEKLKKLRSFCIALSKSAVVFEEPIDDIQVGTF